MSTIFKGFNMIREDMNHFVQKLTIEELKQVEWWVWILISIPVIYTIFILYYMHNLVKNKLKFLEKPIQNLEERFKPFRRVDRESWILFEIYFCAVFLLPIRITLVLVSGVFLAMINTLFVWTSDKNAAQGCMKRSLIKIIYRTCTRIWMFCFGVYWVPKKKLKISDFDETYPAEDYKDRKDRAPILVCNHLGYLDTIYMTNTSFVPSLTAKAEVANYPILGKTGSAIQCIFINRQDRKNKDGVIEKIKERCQQINEGNNYPSILLFPEGTTSNGEYVLSFKKGAFAPFQPIKIFGLKLGDRGFSAYLDENVGYLAHVLLSLCNFYYKLEAIEFETYYPDHLNLQQESDWEIYSNKIRNLMAKALNIKLSDSGYRDCVGYRQLIDEQIQQDQEKIKVEFDEEAKQPDQQTPLIDKRIKSQQYGSDLQ